MSFFDEVEKEIRMSAQESRDFTKNIKVGDIVKYEGIQVRVLKLDMPKKHRALVETVNITNNQCKRVRAVKWKGTKICVFTKHLDPASKKRKK